MIELVSRRGAIALLLASMTTPAFSADALDGASGGLDSKRRTAQIIIVGRQIIGVHSGGDYGDATAVRFAPDGASVSFTFKGRVSRLRRSGAGATLTIQEPSGTTTVHLKNH